MKQDNIILGYTRQGISQSNLGSTVTISQDIGELHSRHSLEVKSPTLKNN